MIKASVRKKLKKTKYQGRIRYWCQDETRLGLITLRSRKVSSWRIQPVGIEQWKFDYLWLYRLVEPISRNSFFWEFSHLDTVCFQEYLKIFSPRFPEDLYVIQLDNGIFRYSQSLEISENIILLFQPRCNGTAHVTSIKCLMFTL